MDTPVHISQSGSNETGDGSIEKPWLTLQHAAEAVQHHSILALNEQGVYSEVSRSLIKKTRKSAAELKRKLERAAERSNTVQTPVVSDWEVSFEKISIADKSTSETISIATVRTNVIAKHAQTRIAVRGWVHRIRAQGNIAFAVIRDGYGLIQVVLTGILCKAALHAAIETCVVVEGMVLAAPEGKTVSTF